MSNEVVWDDTCKYQIPKKNAENNKIGRLPPEGIL